MKTQHHKLLLESVEEILADYMMYGRNRKQTAQKLLQTIADSLPEAQTHFLEARMDTDEEHGLHIGKVEGHNQCLKEVRNLLLGEEK